MNNTLPIPPPAPLIKPPPSRARLTWAALVIGVLALIGVTLQGFALQKTADTAKGAATASQNQAQSLSQQVTDACAKGGTAAAELGPACANAAGIKATPQPAPVNGAIGPQGLPGPQGVKGDPGIQGLPGLVGAHGDPGPVGPPGATGATGPKGDTGATGKAGTDGSQGPQGTPGAAGPPGATGSTGSTGPQGPPPASWMWTDTLGTHTCTRSNTDDSAPTYDCT